MTVWTVLVETIEGESWTYCFEHLEEANKFVEYVNNSDSGITAYTPYKNHLYETFSDAEKEFNKTFGVENE